MARPESAASLIVDEAIGSVQLQNQCPDSGLFPPYDAARACPVLRSARRRAVTAVIPLALHQGAHMTSHPFSMLALIGPLGLPELLIVLAIVILIFGANRLPQLGKGLGQSIRNFKGGLREGEKEEKDA
jgi:sec-independent protein translocase protein TatA